MREAPRSFRSGTSISGAIDYSVAQLARSPYESPRHVINISGDGDNNGGREVTQARDDALARGVTINGLVILQRNRPSAIRSTPIHRANSWLTTRTTSSADRAHSFWKLRTSNPLADRWLGSCSRRLPKPAACHCCAESLAADALERVRAEIDFSRQRLPPQEASSDRRTARLPPS